jgi:hypothetical protein
MCVQDSLLSRLDGLWADFLTVRQPGMVGAAVHQCCEQLTVLLWLL